MEIKIKIGNNMNKDIIDKINRKKTECDKLFSVELTQIKYNIHFMKKDINNVIQSFDGYFHENNTKKQINVRQYDIYYIMDNLVYRDCEVLCSKLIKQESKIIYSSRVKGDTIVEKYIIAENEYLFWAIDKNFFVLVSSSVKVLIMCEKTLEKERQLLRVIKEISLRNVENDGGVLFHSAAIKYNGKGIIIVGGKGAGKTTLLLKCFGCNNVEYVSNDKIYINKDGIVYYVPLSMRVGLGTFEYNNKIKEYQKSNKLERKQFYEEKELYLDVPEEYIKYDLTSRELIKIYNIRAIECMELSFIITPQIVIGSNEIVVSIRTGEEVGKILVDNCISINNKTWPYPWLEERTVSEDKLNQNANFILNRMKSLPIIKLTYGSQVTSEDLEKVLNLLFK